MATRPGRRSASAPSDSAPSRCRAGRYSSMTCRRASSERMAYASPSRSSSLGGGSAGAGVGGRRMSSGRARAVPGPSAPPPRRPRVAPAISRNCHSASRRGWPSESAAPARTSRSTTSSDSSVRATRSANERKGPPLARAASSSSPSAWPMPLSRCSPRRIPYPRADGAAKRSRASSVGTTTADELTTSGRCSMPVPSGSGEPGSPTHSVAVR